MRRVLPVFWLFMLFKPCFSMVAMEESYAMGGCYVYSPNYGEMFRQTPGYSLCDTLNKMLDRLQVSPGIIKSDDMVNIRTQLEALIVSITAIQDTAPDQAASLSSMYCGIVSKLEQLYASQKNAFVNAVNGISDEEAKTAVKGTLRGIGINTEEGE